MNNNSDILDKIKSKLQTIINRHFSRDFYTKKKIDVYHDRWNFACPYCNDSRTDVRKKRGNLYLNSLRFHCFNCGKSIGINSFLKDFDESLEYGDIVKVHEIQQDAQKFEKRNYTSSSQSSIAYQIMDKVAVPKSVFFNKFKLTTPFKNNDVQSYLKSRMLGINCWKYFAYKVDTKELFILNINKNDRIIGYQIRQLDINSKRPRYLTKTISKLYRDMFKCDFNRIVQTLLNKMENGDKYIEEEDGIENIVANLDRLSGLFNVMNISLNKPLTIVEGPIDSMAIDNCIALQGATKMNNYFDDIENVRYLFDNDDVGKKHSIIKLKEHKQVFLWDKYLKTIKCRDKIKDVNDLQKTLNYKLDVFDDCFSDDELDILMI